jgi:hypothetical protein
VNGVLVGEGVRLGRGWLYIDDGTPQSRPAPKKVFRLAKQNSARTSLFLQTGILFRDVKINNFYHSASMFKTSLLFAGLE